MMGGCVSAGAATYMRALGAARRSVRAAIFTSISLLVGSLVGAVAGGVVGAVHGAAAAAFSRLARLLVATTRDAPGDAWHTHSREASSSGTEGAPLRTGVGSRCRRDWSSIDGQIVGISHAVQSDHRANGATTARAKRHHLIVACRRLGPRHGSRRRGESPNGYLLMWHLADSTEHTSGPGRA